MANKGLTNSLASSKSRGKAQFPPNITHKSFDPTTRDYFNFSIGDIWINNGTTLAPLSRVWILIAQRRNVATWVLFVSGAGGDITQLTASDGTVAIPVLGNITFPAGANISSTAAGSNFTVYLNNSIALGLLAPATTLIDLYTSTAAATGGNVNYKKSRLGGVILNGDSLGALNFQGFDGVAYTTGATIQALSNGAVAPGIVPTQLQLFTMGTAGVLTVRMIIGPQGNVLINAPASGDALTVFGDIVMPATTAANVGVLYIGANRFLHGYGTANTFVGNASGNTTLTVVSASSNTGVGNSTLIALTTGADNTAVASTALLNLTTGSNNVALGASLTSLTTGSQNTAVGNGAFAAGGGSLLTGSGNTGIGWDSGSNYTGAESNNLLLNNDGVLGESNTTRIGTNGGGAGQQNRCFIAGIRGITTGVNDAIAVLIDSAHQLGTVSSSARYKQNIQDMGDQSSLIMDLRPVTFNYKEHPTVPSWGLIAEEVDKVFPQLVVYDKDGQAETVKYHELVPLMLNELQKQQNEIASLHEKCDALMIVIQDLFKGVSRR